MTPKEFQQLKLNFCINIFFFIITSYVHLRAYLTPSQTNNIASRHIFLCKFDLTFTSMNLQHGLMKLHSFTKFRTINLTVEVIFVYLKIITQKIVHIA